MIEVQVRDHDCIDVLVGEPGRTQRLEQDVAILYHAVALAHARLEECPDAGFEQHVLAIEPLHEQATARERDAIVLVRFDPACPHGAGRIAEHRTAIELLSVALE